MTPAPTRASRATPHFFPRLAAILIDLLIAWVLLQLAVTIIVPGAVGNDPTPHETSTLGAITLILLTVWFNYLVVSEWLWGKTVGKLAIGLEVAAVDGRELTWNRAVVRNLLLVVDVIAGLFMIPTSARHQRLGDRLAHTIVLAKREAARRRKRQAAGRHPPSSVPPPPRRPGLPTARCPAPPPLPAMGSGDPAAGTRREPGGRPRRDRDPGPARDHRRRGRHRLDLRPGARLAGGEAGQPGAARAHPGGRGLRGHLRARPRASPRPRRSAFGGRFARRSASARGRAVVAAATAYVAYVVAAAIYSSLLHPHQKDITRDLGFGHGGLGTVAAGVLIVVAAPVSEEIFFRGFIFGGLRSGCRFGRGPDLGGDLRALPLHGRRQPQCGPSARVPGLRALLGL